MTDRRPTGAECECTMCGRYFGSESAFNLHLRQAPYWDCVDPASLRYGSASARAGQPRLIEVLRKGGPTWIANGPEWRLPSDAAGDAVERR